MLQGLNVFLAVRGPKLDTALEVRPHQDGVQGDNYFPVPAGHNISDTSQDAIGLLGHLGTLSVHVQLSISQHPQVPFLFTVIQPLSPKPTALHGVTVAKVQYPAFGLVESHPIGFSPAIQPIQIPL